MKSPILLLTFNRLQTTKKVFEKIKEYRPDRLYVVSDGSRNNKPEEFEIVNEVRSFVTQNVDWPCKLVTLFRDHNLGCGRGVSEGITWFFVHEERGIILEDDCLPTADFFNYCDTLLELYESDPKIMHIGGDASYLFGNTYDQYSYRFTNYPHVWGWATWKRAWNTYSYKVNFDFSTLGLEDKLKNKSAIGYWKNIWHKMNTQPLDTWDYQWVFTIWRNNGISISPNYNMISNIGFGKAATHTTEGSIVANASVEKMNFPLVPAPKYFINDKVETLDFIVTSTGLMPLRGWRRVIRDISRLVIPFSVRSKLLKRFKSLVYRID